MTLDATDMLDEVIANLPSDWRANYQDGKPPKEWFKALCDGVVDMWLDPAILLSPGPTPDAPHPHVFLPPTLNPAKITARTSLLGYTGAAALFAAIAGAVAATLSSAVATVDGPGVVNHTAGVTTTAFASVAALATVLESAMKSAAAGVGIIGADVGGQNSLDTVFGAQASGICDHIANNAEVSLAGGDGHTHTRS